MLIIIFYVEKFDKLNKITHKLSFAMTDLFGNNFRVVASLLRAFARARRSIVRRGNVTARSAV